MTREGLLRQSHKPNSHKSRPKPTRVSGQSTTSYSERSSHPSRSREWLALRSCSMLYMMVNHASILEVLRIISQQFSDDFYYHQLTNSPQLRHQGARVLAKHQPRICQQVQPPLRDLSPNFASAEQYREWLPNQPFALFTFLVSKVSTGRKSIVYNSELIPPCPPILPTTYTPIKMKGSILELTLLATSIFTLATSKTLKNLPQLRTNATLHQAGQILTTSNTPNTPNLAPRDYYTCSPGYSSCAYDSTRCCPSDNTCCGNGYCADPGDVCCTVGTCPSGWDCCGNEGYCSPVDGECCSDGYYCFAGTHCRIWDGERVCCPAGGCLGSSDEGELGSTISAGPIGSMTTDTVTTEPSVSYSYTSSVGYVDYEYYYTTVYW